MRSRRWKTTKRNKLLEKRIGPNRGQSLLSTPVHSHPHVRRLRNIHVARFPQAPFIAKLARGRKNNRLLEWNQTNPQGVVDQLRHGVHLELGEGVRPVGLDGFDAEAQLGGDLLGRFAVGDEAGGFSFALGEGGEFAVGPGDVVAHGGDAVRAEPVMMPDRVERGE